VNICHCIELSCCVRVFQFHLHIISSCMSQYLCPSLHWACLLYLCHVLMQDHAHVWRKRLFMWWVPQPCLAPCKYYEIISLIALNNTNHRRTDSLADWATLEAMLRSFVLELTVTNAAVSYFVKRFELTIESASVIASIIGFMVSNTWRVFIAYPNCFHSIYLLLIHTSCYPFEFFRTSLLVF